MIDLGMTIEDVDQLDESFGVPFEKALHSLRRTRREIGSKLHAVYLPVAWHL